MKKKLLSLFLVLALFLSLVGCGDDTATPKQDATTQTSTTTTVSESPSDSADDTTTAQPTDGDTTDGVTDGSTTGKPTSTTTAEGSSSSGTTVTTVTPTTTTATAKPTTTATAKPTATATTAPSADKLLVDRAFALAQGETIEGVTLTGVVTSSQGYSEDFGNATFYIQVEGTGGPQTLYCYRVKPANANRTDVVRGETVTLSGTIQNYKGTIEFYPANYVHVGGTVATTTTRPTGSGTATIDENGIYDSKEDVALYIHIYGKLPKNYYPKSEFNKDDEYQCCGGDRFYNKEGLLPNGETYYECDIDTYGIVSRGAKRLVWTKSGIVYYTDDHYESFTKLYGER